MSATISASGLAKRYGSVQAVHEVSFVARAGRVTGFLGPNGAGKSTTLRMMLGLVRPDSGSVLFDGTPYRELPNPSGTVGASVDLAGAHPAMTARGHLRATCELGGHRRDRIDEVAELTGVSAFLDRRIRGYSTGMRQRLSLANALLGDPGVLVLDEPTNGLDPAGIFWLRSFLRDFAASGGTVLLSSHVLSELEQAIDDLVLIDRGRVTWTGTLEQFVAQGASLEQAFLDATRTSRPTDSDLAAQEASR